MDNTSAIFDRNVPFNQLPLLPPPQEAIYHDVLGKWGLVSRTLAELSKNILRLPNPGMFINTISLHEAKASTAIENIFTTDDELYKAISDRVKGKSANPNTKEVLRYREALWAGYSEIIEKKEMDIDLFIKAYQQIKAANQGIRLPHSLVIIRQGDSKFRAVEVIYTPTRGMHIIEEKLEHLLDFLNNELTPKSPFTPKSPKGNFVKLLIFSITPFRAWGKK